MGGNGAKIGGLGRDGSGGALDLRMSGSLGGKKERLDAPAVAKPCGYGTMFGSGGPGGGPCELPAATAGG